MWEHARGRGEHGAAARPRRRRRSGPDDGLPRLRARGRRAAWPSPPAIAAAAWRLATGRRARPRGSAPARDGRAHAGADRPGPLRLEPLERQDGFRARRGGARPGRARHAARRARRAFAAPEGVRVLVRSRRRTISTACSCGSSRSATASSMAAAVTDFIPEASAGRLHRADGAQHPAPRAGPRHPREPGAAQARPDGRRLRGRDRGPRGARPPQDGSRRAPT